MSVTQYTIGCGYELLKLKDTVFFLSKNSLKTITIDNGEAYVDFVNQSPQPPSPNRLKGFNVKLTETESLDERYVFTKQLTMSVHGHLTDSQFLMDDDYYIVVQTEDGTYYLVNVDFPSKMSFVYNLSEGQDQTDFTFVSNSNHPTLKLNWNPVTWNTCQTYQVFGIDGLKLLEKDYTTIDVEQGVINLFDGNEFKDVDYLKNTISLQENYDGKIATTTISFEIPFNNYKPSWQYNLLEFDQNLYVAHITPKNSTSGIFCGFEHGLEPSYEINGNTSIGESTTIKITLTEASEWGIFELDTWSYYRDSSKRWVGIDSEVKCTSLGVGINTLMQEVDGNGTPTGRYKCLEGFESEYTNYNIITSYTESDVESFRTSVCTRFRTRGTAPTGYYTCINGDKYELVKSQYSYDGGNTWVFDGGYEIGELVETGSTWCQETVETQWILNEDKWQCGNEPPIPPTPPSPTGLPQGYTEVEYIENSTLAYLDSGFKPNQDTRIVAEMQCVTSTSYNQHFGCGGWNVYNGIRMGYESGISGTLHVKYGINNSWTVYSNVTGDLNKHTYDWNKNEFYMDNSLVGSTTYGNFQTTDNLGIFFVVEGSVTPTSEAVFKGRVYSFKIYDDGVLVRDLVPCKRGSDNMVGMYDLVNGVFYYPPNYQSYQLVAGPVVS